MRAHRTLGRLAAGLAVGGLVAAAALAAEPEGTTRRLQATGGSEAGGDVSFEVVDPADPTTIPSTVPPVSVPGRLPAPPRVVLPRVTVPPVPVTVTVPVTTPTLPTTTTTAPPRACADAVRTGPSGLDGPLRDHGTYVADADGGDVGHVVASADPGRWDRRRERLAYTVAVDGRFSAVCVLEKGAARQVAVVEATGGFTTAGALLSWTANGTLAVVDVSSRVARLRVLDPSSGRELAGFDGVYPHEVSPDGRRAAFVTPEMPQELRVADLGTGAVRTVARLDAEQYRAFLVRWTPDGSAIAYRTAGLRRIDVDTGERRVLVGDEYGGAGAYAFAPDGRLAYSTHLGGDGGEVFVADADGGNARRVATGPVRWLSWSPAGDRLLLARGHGDESSLAVVGADGTGERTLLRARARAGERPLRFVVNDGWSPDGSRIEFGLWRDLG